VITTGEKPQFAQPLTISESEFVLVRERPTFLQVTRPRSKNVLLEYKVNLSLTIFLNQTKIETGSALSNLPLFETVVSPSYPSF
jgi:hypothetical protein